MINDDEVSLCTREEKINSRAKKFVIRYLSAFLVMYRFREVIIIMCFGFSFASEEWCYDFHAHGGRDFFLSPF